MKQKLKEMFHIKLLLNNKKHNNNNNNHKINV